MALLSTSLPTTISLLFCTLLLSVPISSYPLDNICKQTKNPSFCFNLLKPEASASLQQISKFVIDATTTSASRTTAKIKSLLSQTSDPSLIAVYSLCSNYYSAALSALGAAAADLKSAAATVSEDAASCRRAFALAPSKPIAIAGDNDELDRLSNVLVVVASRGGSRNF